MCGRFAQATSARDYARSVGAERVADSIISRWNVAPSLAVGMIHDEGAQRLFDLWHWGFVPHWARDPDSLRRPVNAKVETVAEKPMFRDAWRRNQRGLIPAEGFYEWRVERGRKQPWFIRRRNGEPLLLAAIWDRWQRAGGEPWKSCAILVGPANERVATLHERMPVIIPRAGADRWLARAIAPGDLAELLLPPPAGELEAFRVSTKVNSAINEGPELVTPL